MLQIKDEIPVRAFPDKPKRKRKVRLAVDPKTITKPPKTKPQPKQQPSANTEPAAPPPSAPETELERERPDPTPVVPAPRQTPYLWRNRSQDDNVDRQGRRWTRE